MKVSFKSLAEMEACRLEFEKYASNRGMSIERTCDSYKTQASKSAWGAWKYQQIKINKLNTLIDKLPRNIFDGLEVYLEK